MHSTTRSNLKNTGPERFCKLLTACRNAVHLPQTRILMASCPEVPESKCALAGRWYDDMVVTGNCLEGRFPPQEGIGGRRG